MPWADVLYACDADWWHKNGGAPKFTGLKVGQGDFVPRPEWGVRKVRITRGDDRMCFDEFGRLGWGGNSGFHAINLAVQFGVRSIVLVGFDMRLDHGVHWHGKHGSGLNNPTVNSTKGWRLRLDAVAGDLAAIGVEVLNASPISALQNYKKVDFASLFDAEEAIDAAA